jgi:hypothetical protein
MSLDLFRLLVQGLRLSVLLRPGGAASPLLPGLLFAAIALHLLVGIVIDWHAVAAPHVFDPWVASERSFPVLLALLGGLLGAGLVSRPALWLRLAAIALVAALPVQAIWTLSGASFDPELAPRWQPWLLMGYATLAGLRLLAWAAAAPLAYPRWLAAALLAPLFGLSAAVMLPGSSWWWTQQDESDAPWWALPRDYSAEQLMYAQPGMLAAAVDQLAPPQPQQIDLFAIGFAADGGEGVFRNEVEYLEQLVSQRFASPQRTLKLINHPDTIRRDPLATLTNLRAALAAVGQRLDPNEDILLLYLTSHGSQQHELDVVLHDLPLDPIDPSELRAALDASGIQWRVVVISACFSGGFLDALRDPRTLIITAARADRPSFGCGVASDITWFGQALLAEALNETLDFGAAFAIAKAAIRQREEAQDEPPSHPQIDFGKQIAVQLQRWREQVQPGHAVEFVPTVPGWRPEPPRLPAPANEPDS